MKKPALIYLTLLAHFALGQLLEVPLGHSHSGVGKNNSNSMRIQSLPPLKLPFWDDFSFTKTDYPDVPNDTLWNTGKSVWVNNGIAINPPSIFAASFDGIDSTGKPYNVTEVLAKGFADRLVSRVIDLSELTAQQNDSVFLSFFYQVTGKGEAPDKDDNFSLWLKDNNGTWEKVFEVGNSVALNPAIFYYQIVKVDPKYFHKNFQFKFQNFARLSGPYDTWNLDYIYLNKRRSATDIYFHDQTLTKPLSSIFRNYRAIPIKHFKDTATAVLISPKAGFYNLYKFEAQSFKYTSSVRIDERTGGVLKQGSPLIIELNGDAQAVLPKFTHFELELNQTVPLSFINLSADSVGIDFKLGFDSGDKNIVPETPLFYPINFTHNDTVHAEFTLHKHYAYDDGSAEYGAGLNQPGAQMAYGFDMLTKETDTVEFVDIYFPQFGDNTSQSVILKFWNSSLGKPFTEMYRETITVNRTTGNTFHRYHLNESVGVKGRFFVGWEQKASIMVPVGLDKNTTSGEQMFYNITGTWEQNQNISGSLMIRPVFGRGKAAIISAVEDNVEHVLFPNPSYGHFYLSAGAEIISISNMFGSTFNYSLEQTDNKQRVMLTDPTPGIYIVRWQEVDKLYSTKVLVRN